MKIIEFFVCNFTSPNKKGEGYVGYYDGKVVLPSIKEKGEYACISPEDRGRYYLCKKVVAFKNINRIFGMGSIRAEYESILKENGISFEEFEEMPEDRVVSVKGYKIPVALFRNNTSNIYQGVIIENVIIGSTVKDGRVIIEIFSNGENIVVNETGIAIGDERISYNKYAYRFENGRFILEPSLDMVIDKLYRDLNNRIPRDLILKAEKFATKRWQDEIGYQKKVADRFDIAEEQIKKLPEKIYIITNIEYSIGREMRHTPWASVPVEYYVIKKVDVVEGKRENSVKVCSNLYMSKALVERIMQEVSNRDISLQGESALIEAINNTFCTRIRVKSPYDEMNEWEESYYFPNNGKPNLPEDGISFWRWARKEEF
jgi:hypothetical protein